MEFVRGMKFKIVRGGELDRLVYTVVGISTYIYNGVACLQLECNSDDVFCKSGFFVNVVKGEPVNPRGLYSIYVLSYPHRAQLELFF